MAARFEKGAQARGRFGYGIGRGDADGIEALAAGIDEKPGLLGRKGAIVRGIAAGFVQKSRSA